MIHVISNYFPGYLESGGIHSYKDNILYLKKNVIEKLFPDLNYTWHIGWQKFQLPGMEPEKEPKHNTENIIFYPLPHIMTPAKVYTFLLQKIPEKERVFFLDLKIAEIIIAENFDISIDIGSNIQGTIFISDIDDNIGKDLEMYFKKKHSFSLKTISKQHFLSKEIFSQHFTILTNIPWILTSYKQNDFQ